MFRCNWIINLNTNTERRHYNRTNERNSTADCSISAGAMHNESLLNFRYQRRLVFTMEVSSCIVHFFIFSLRTQLLCWQSNEVPTGVVMLLKQRTYNLLQFLCGIFIIYIIVVLVGLKIVHLDIVEQNVTELEAGFNNS